MADTGEPLLATTTESLHAAAKNQHSQDKQLKGSTRARGAVIVTGSGAQGTVCRFVEGLPGQQRVRRRLPCETVMRTQAGRRQTLKPWQTFTGTIQIFLWTNVNFLCGWMQPRGSQFESFDTKPLNPVGSSCCSFAQSCPTLCDPMDCSTPGFPVFHHLLEFTQTLVH